MDNFSLRSLATKLNNMEIEDCERAVLLGEFIELFPMNIRRAMTIGLFGHDGTTYNNREHTKELRHFYGILDKYDTEDSVEMNPDDLIQNKWFKSPYLKYTGNAKNPNDNQYFIYDFGFYLDRFVIRSIEDVIELYKRCCIFYKKYIEFDIYRGRKTDVESICKFLVYDIINHCFEACEILYRVWKPEEEMVIFEDFFSTIKTLDTCIKENSWNSFSFVICNFYKSSGLNFDYISENKFGRDPMLSLLIDMNCDKNRLVKENIISRYIRLILLGNENSLPNEGRIYSESPDISFEFGDVSGESKNNIVAFGSNDIFGDMNNSIDTLEMELSKFDSEFIKEYLDKGEHVLVNFNIHEQFKMYLQAELGGELSVVATRRGGELTMYTILRYEKDDFVLFTLSDDNDTIYGLSVTENKINGERRLITIDRDEDLTFQFVMNENE